jgi:hypothetical protein
VWKKIKTERKITFLVVQGGKNLPAKTGGTFLRSNGLTEVPRRNADRLDELWQMENDFNLPPHQFSTPRAKRESVPLLAGKFLPSPGHGTTFQYLRPWIFSHLQED